jgi:two-component system LytT family response regulator
MGEGVRLRAVVVDDEPGAREVVTTLIAEFPDIVVAGEAGDGSTAVALIQRTKPDLLFLDVQMPGLDGFGVLDALGDDVPRGVIFVTAHDEHAVDAFERHALDYLLKPFGRPRFVAAVTRAVERVRAIDALNLQRTFGALRTANDRATPGVLSVPEQAPSTPARRIGVRTGAKTVIIETPEIDWIAADGDYVRIHAGKQSHLASQRMQEMENVLDPAQFARIHRSVIVNIDRVRELRREPDGSGSLVLKNGIALRVARSRWEALERMLGLRPA